MKVYQPTNDRIKQECEKIRQTWSEKETYKRAGGLPQERWTPPIVSIEELDTTPSSEF